jgi:hypothetical protein
MGIDWIGGKINYYYYFYSVVDLGSGAFLTPGPGSGIPKPYFLELSDKFLGKKFYNSLKTRPIFFQHFKNKIIFNFVKFVATKKGMTTNFFPPSLLLRFLDPGSDILDPGWVKKSGPGIRDKHPGSATLYYYY